MIVSNSERLKELTKCIEEEKLAYMDMQLDYYERIIEQQDVLIKLLQSENKVLRSI